MDYLGRQSTSKISQILASLRPDKILPVETVALNHDLVRKQPSEHPSGCSSAASQVHEPGRRCFDLNALPDETGAIDPAQVGDFLTLSLAM